MEVSSPWELDDAGLAHLAITFDVVECPVVTTAPAITTPPTTTTTPASTTPTTPGTTPATVVPAAATKPTPLAQTGATTAPALAIGGLMLLLGGAALWRTRRSTAKH